MHRFANIIIAAVWLMAMVPCSHAFYPSSHDHGAGRELCESVPADCHCHSCDGVPCTESVRVEAQRPTVSGSILFTAAMYRIERVMECKSPVQPTFQPSIGGIHESIGTIRLLI